MPARILILDTVATNRIVLKVKMIAAQFHVEAYEDTATAQCAIAIQAPDLILTSMSDSTGQERALCKSLRASPTTADIAIIAVGVADTSQARFAALDAGADDVMPRPLNDTLLLARIRSLLRMRSASQEFTLREGTSRALGFEEGRSAYAPPARTAFVGVQTDANSQIIGALTAAWRQPLARMDQATALSLSEPAVDLLVIDASRMDPHANAFFGFVSELRTREGTRRAAQLVLVPPGAAETAAMFLDLGADDVVFADSAPAEICLRAKSLISRKQQQDQLRSTVRDGLHAAVTDPLTGLYNRRYVAQHLNRIACEAQASGREFAVMMIDIDHFKAINDTYGHAAGDRVLVQLSDRLRENLRAIDLVARMGGEEFLIAMPRTPVRRAQLAADRLRRTIHNTPFDIGEGLPKIDISVSVGVAVSAQINDEITPYEQLCESADAALYVAKSAGRNQVAVGQSAA